MTRKKDIFCTVILPNYKTESFLEEALNSVKNQSFRNFECILINDGSPGVSKEEDNFNIESSVYKRKVKLDFKESKNQCREIFKKVVGLDKRFKLFEKENGGQGSARNLALDNSNGKYILFLDCDDYFEEGHLQKIAETLKEYKNHEDTIFLFNNVKEFYIENGIKNFRSDQMIAQKAKKITFETYLVFNHVGITNCVVSKGLIGNTRFTWLTKSMEDVEIIYRLGSKLNRRGKKLNFKEIDISTVHRRLHLNSITYYDANRGFVKEKSDKIKAFKNLLLNECLSFRQKIIVRIGIIRFRLNNNFFQRTLRKLFTFLAKIISGWYA